MAKPSDNNKKKTFKKNREIICRCNNVNRQTIEEAIRDGKAHTLNQIFDQTCAGVGPCGGSCRWVLAPFLEFYLTNGEFPEKLPKGKKKSKKR